MDRKQLITGLAVTVAVVGLYFGFLQLLKRMEPQLFVAPPAAEQTDQAQSTPAPATSPPATNPGTQPAVAGGTATAPAPLPTITAGPAPVISAIPAKSAPDQVILGAGVAQVDPTSPYAMRVSLSPYGAAINSVTLNRFGSSDNHKAPYVFQTPYDGHDDSASLSSRCVVINGTYIDLSHIPWTVSPDSDSTHASFIVPLVDAAGKPVATLTKTYRLAPAGNDPNTAQGYELSVDLSVANQSPGPLSVAAAYNGPTMPPKEIDRSDDRNVVVANSTGPADVAVTQHFLAEFKPAAPEMDLTKDKSDVPAVWVGESSAYFDAIVLPLPISTAPSKPPQYTIKANALEVENDDRDVVLTYTSDTQTVAAGQTLSMPASVFLGPKMRSLLGSAYYSAYPRQYNKSLVVHGSCGFLTFDWLVNTLVAILWAFHFVTRDWGLAIICLVCLVRLLLHPITKKSQVTMMKMGKMGPEIERLKKKYGDDKEALNKAMMDVYKDQGPATLMGCLPMFLQMPIWVALWGALNSTFELRQSKFLWGFTWINDLARPDAVLHWSTITIPYLKFTISSLNILPILMGVVFYLQQKYTPKPPAATPEQEQQQKMMQYMSLLFPCFLYNSPSGLNLYILTSTTIGIFENRIIRKHIKEREEAEKAGRVFVDVKPTRAKKMESRDKNKPKDDGKKSKLGRWLAELQQRADQVRTEAERAKKRRET